MVYMSVGYEDVGNLFASHGAKEGLDVGFIVWAGIDDGDFAVSDYVGACASESELPRIVGRDPADQGGDLLRFTVRHFVISVEQGLQRKRWVSHGLVSLFRSSTHASFTSPVLASR